MANLTKKVVSVMVVLLVGSILLPIGLNAMSKPVALRENEELGTADGSGILTANVSNPPIRDDYNVTLYNSTDDELPDSSYTIDSYEDGTISVDDTTYANDTIYVDYATDLGAVDTIWSNIPIIAMIGILIMMITAFVRRDSR